MKNSRIVRVTLLFALIAIFAGVFYEVKENTASRPEQSAAVLDSDGKVSRIRSRYVYEADVRDPFLLVKPAAKTHESQRQAFVPRVWTPPPYSLKGTVMNGTRRVAVLESASGEVFFLSAGDSLQGLTIRKIDKDSVFFSFAGQKKSWGVR